MANIDDLLLDLEEIGSEETALETKKKTEIDASSQEELAEELIKITKDDRKMADRLFELFYPEIMSGQDRSQASKEALSRALELKIAAGRNIIDLLKIMKDSEKANTAIGVFFNERKAGISIDSMKDNYNDDD